MIPLRSRILDVGVRSAFHTLLLLSLFLLFRGHDQPGGGFSGGLVAGAAFVLLWVARGPATLRWLPVGPEPLIGLGLLTIVTTGIAGMLLAGQFLESGYLLAVETDPFGSIRLPSVAVFDIGIYLLVLGFVTLALERLGTDRTNGSTP